MTSGIVGTAHAAPPRRRIGFIGLGHLGGHLAASLVRAGFEVTVYDLDPDAMTRLRDLGARGCADAAEAARGRDAVITCLPSPTVSAEVLLGDGGALPAMDRGSAWIEMSTTDRDEVTRIASLALARGVRTLEAPVTGGVHLARAGRITVLVGGAEEDLRRYRGVLAAMGGQIHHIGPLGSASVMKVITNMLAFVHLVGVGEALMLAKCGGIDLARAFHAIAASSGTSFVHETEGQVILNGSYNIGFTMDLACKDLGLAARLGREFGVPLELAGHASRLFELARERYGGGAWSPMVVRLVEDAVGTSLRAEGFPEVIE
jgi:3-hydroxyisobutyrate dehydrogenase